MERSTALTPITATVRDGWLNGQTTQATLSDGEVLGALIERCFDPALEQYLVAQVNGEFMREWKDYIPAHDDHISVYVLPQGGDSGKQSLMLVASIAVAAFAGPAVGALSQTWLGSTGAAIAYTVGTSVVMAALSRAIFKPPQQEDNGQSAINPFYSISNASNAFRPMGAVPNIYGTIRFTPAQVVQPQPGIDQTTGLATWTMLLDFGYGYVQLTDILVDQTNIDTLTSDYYVHHNYTKGTPLKHFSNVNLPTDALNALIDKEGVVRTTAKETKRLSILINFPQGLYQLDANGTFIPQKVEFNILCKVKGEPDSAYKSIYDYALTSNPENYDQPNVGWLDYYPNFEPWPWTALGCETWVNSVTGAGTEWYVGIRAGTQILAVAGDFIEEKPAGQGPYINRPGFVPNPPLGNILDPRENIPAFLGFTFIYDNRYQDILGPGLAIVLDQPIAQDIVLERHVTDQPTFIASQNRFIGRRSYGVRINYRQLPPYLGKYYFEQWSEWGGRSRHFNNYFTSTIDFVNYNPLTNTLDTRSPFQIEREFDFIYPNQYDIKIVNLGDTAGSDNLTLKNEMRWNSYTSFTGETTDTFQPDVPHTVLELKIRATDQVSGTVGTISAVATRWLDLYSWKDDLWHFWPTRNPAWAYYDVLTGSANRNPVPAHLIDLEAIKEWAEECDQEVINENTLPIQQFTCDLIIQGSSTIKYALDAIAATGRAVPCRRDMKHSIIRRQPVNAVPVQLFTQKNVRNFTATIDYIDPPHGIKVNFMDEATDYKPNQVIVYDNPYDPKIHGNNALVAHKFEELSLPGTCRYNQAWRFGRYYLASTLLERERVTFNCDIEHIICQRGDLVYCTSDYLKAGGLPRRITKVELDHFWLDEPSQGINTIRFRGSADLVSVTIVSDQEFIVQAGYESYLKVGDLIEWGVTNEIKAPYIVEDVQPGIDFSANLRLVEFRPEVDDAVTGPISDRLVAPGAVDGFAIGPVTGLELDIHAERDASGITIRSYYLPKIVWNPPVTGRVDRYNIYQVRAQGQAYDWIGSTTYSHYDLPRIWVSDVKETLRLRFAVEPVVDLRGKGPMAEVEDVITPNTAPPFDVEFLNINVQTETLMLFWNSFQGNQMVDLSHFEIRYSADNAATWDVASKMIENVPADLSAMSVPMRVGRYFIKAVNFSGVYSLAAASDVTQVNDSSITEQNQVIDFAPFTNGEYWNVYNPSTGVLAISDGQTMGEYRVGDSSNLHFSAISRIRLTASIEAESVYIDSNLADDWFSPLSDARPLSGPSQQVLDQASAQIYFRRRVAYNVDPDINYTDWEVLTVADVTATDIEFKIVMTSPDSAITARVISASVTTDWVQRFESASNEYIAAQNQPVYFDNEFAVTPTMTVTIMNAEQGDWVRVTQGTLTDSFLVTLFDVNGNWKTGTISWIAKGYGKLF